MAAGPLGRAKPVESIRRGGTLVSVRTDESKADQAELIMQRRESVVKERGRANGEHGWKSFGPDAPSYTEKERQKERDRYRPIH